MPTDSEDIASATVSEQPFAESPATNGASPANEPNVSVCGSKTSTIPHDPTPYVQRARVTRPAPPKPSCNPMQFVQIKPCNLFKTAQEQLKRAEEVKKVKEIKKEEPEEWQNNLDNWKSSRRKRVEHIIDRVVEVKKLELEEHDRSRRKSKTFSEMLEDRGDRGRGRTKLASLAVYNEDESNDLSDLGLGTSSASGKSSLSEDYDNHSVMSDGADLEKTHYDLDHNSNHENDGTSREYISSPGYDTSSSTAPASSPDPCEYTYEGAIEDYKSRVSRASSNSFNTEFRNSGVSNPYLKDSTPEEVSTSETPYQPRRGSKIEDRLISFEVKSPNDMNENSTPKRDLPKVDILKRRELFEKDISGTTKEKVITQKRMSGDFSAGKSIRERLSCLEQRPSTEEAKKSNKHSGDITSIKDRLNILEKQTSVVEKVDKVSKVADVQVPTLKDRLSSLQSAVTKEEVKKPVVLVDQHQLEVMKNEELAKLKREVEKEEEENLSGSHEVLNIHDESNVDTDREDSGIHTTDVSCSVSQTDEQAEMVNVETHHHINEDGLAAQHTEAAPSESDTSLEVLSPEPTADLDLSVNEALELALQAIDEETNQPPEITELIPKSNHDENQNDLSPISKTDEPIYEVIGGSCLPPSVDPTVDNPPPLPPQPPVLSAPLMDDAEPHYQVPKSSEPYYEVPKYQKPVPVYENIEIFYPEAVAISNGPVLGLMEPPKEKPPPPPIDDLADDEDDGSDDTYATILENPSPTKLNETPMKRMNSTKRIKKEIRNKRSSFLGIEGNGDDESFLEMTVAPPPDMAQLLQEERRLEKQLYMKAGLYESSDTGESRDSGVSENHSRQSSEPFTNSSEEHDRHEDLLSKKEMEIIQVLEKEEEKQKHIVNNCGWPVDETDAKMQCIEDQIREQEEVLRVERELLQLEQEELKRQQENLMLRENLARRELEHSAKMLMSANRRSLQDINNASANVYANIPNQIYQIETDYRKSMSDLHDYSPKRMPPAPPVKPLRTQIPYDSRQMTPHHVNGGGLVQIAPNYHHPPAARMQHAQSTENFVPLRNYQPASALHHGNMSRNTLHALSATPKPKYTDGWVQSQKTPENSSDAWLSYQQKRKSVPDGFNYNKHWLIQEAEQRRIEQQTGNVRTSAPNGWAANTNNGNGNYSAIQRNGSSDNKPLPDAVIQTLTQRVQSKGIGERKRLETRSSESLAMPPSNSVPIGQPLPPLITDNGPQDKVLSVSGKKKCSHCGDELGRGAAMIIESLRLFYHINCFKCCVCHVQLSDGLNGTDVRVRNHKLHCQNCYSSDDGIKFSCV